MTLRPACSFPDYAPATSAGFSRPDDLATFPVGQDMSLTILALTLANIAVHETNAAIEDALERTRARPY